MVSTAGVVVPGGMASSCLLWCYTNAYRSANQFSLAATQGRFVMAISTSATSIQLQRRLFSIEDYYRMLEAGILAPEERVELRKGVLFTAQSDTERLFTVAEYERLGEAGILKSDEHVEL